MIGCDLCPPSPAPWLRLNPSMPAPRPSSLPAPARSAPTHCRSPKPGGQSWGVPPPKPLRGVPAGGAVASLGCLSRDPGTHWRPLSPERSRRVPSRRQRSRGSAAGSLPQLRSRAGAPLPVVPPGVRRHGVKCTQSAREGAVPREPDPGARPAGPETRASAPRAWRSLAAQKPSPGARPPSASRGPPPAISAPSEPRTRPRD